MRENSTVEVYMHLADLKRQFSKSDIRKNFILRNMGGEDFFFRHKAVQRGKTVQNRTGTWYEDDERRKLGINIEWKRCQRRRLIKNIWPECERLVERWPAGGQLLPSGPTSTPTWVWEAGREVTCWGSAPALRSHQHTYQYTNSSYS